MSRILLVDDDAALLRTLTLNLRARHYAVDSAATGREALALAAQQPPDLAVVDLGLPDMDGLEVVAALRGKAALPILVLSARTEERDKVAALDAGGDDHISKPFGMEELLARVRASLRRGGDTAGAGASVVRTAGFTVDLAACRVTTPSGEVRLTPTEWHLLEVLARTPGQLVPQLALLQEVWGPAYVRETHYLRVYLAQLRRKLEVDPAQPRHLVTVAGLGYRLEL